MSTAIIYTCENKYMKSKSILNVIMSLVSRVFSWEKIQELIIVHNNAYIYLNRQL